MPKDYDDLWNMTLREWLAYHQREIVFDQCSWMGTSIMKNPFDAWIYQEIVHEVRPATVIEIGSRSGGSTMFFANLLDLVGHGRVISVEIDRSDYTASHERIVDVTGDSSSPEVVDEVRAQTLDGPVLVIHDGDHHRDAVLRDLRAYAPMVTTGSYLIVEDGIVDLMPHDEMAWEPDEPGPMRAVERFLQEDAGFVVDESRERYLLTYNPMGFLRKVA